MKINTTSAVGWALAICCAAGTLLVTPASYASVHHSKTRIVREDRGNEHNKKDSRKDKGTERDDSPDKGDN